MIALIGLACCLYAASARAQGEQTACEAPIGPTDGTGPVFRNTRLLIADTAGGTEFTFGGCLQNNGPAGGFAGFLIKGLIFDRAGNLLGFATTETVPVPSANQPAGDQGAPSEGGVRPDGSQPNGLQPNGLQPWAMTSNAGYPISHAQVRPNVLLIVYARACPDGLPAHCGKPYDTGPTYILLTPCVIDAGAIVPATEGSCPAAALAAARPMATPAATPAAPPMATPAAVAAPPTAPTAPEPPPAPAASPPATPHAEPPAAKPPEPRPAAPSAAVRRPRPRRVVPSSPHRNSEP
jgi:hypothetical protein